MIRRKYLRWAHLILATAVTLGVGMSQGIAAPKNPPNKKLQLDALAQQAASVQQQALTASTLAATFTSPTDQTKVPHYFGPFPNWANSPFTVTDATVQITGDGTGAAATATVDTFTGAVTGVTITNPGSGYTTATVTFGGSGTGASADAVITPDAVTTVNVALDPLTGLSGAGYTAPTVAFVGGCTPTPGCEATGTAYGGVDSVALVTDANGITGGSGYTMPTVVFTLPEDPNGVAATAVALTADDGSGTGTLTVTGIEVVSPGSGYSSAPGVTIIDGTVANPVLGAVPALATASLGVQYVTLNTFGSGYTTAPTVSFADASGTGSGASATAVIDAGPVTGVTNLIGGSGYITAGGMKKFVDGLPMLCDPSVTDPAAAGYCVPNDLGQYLPVGVPDTTTFTIANGFDNDADYYVIALVQHRECMSSSLPGCDPAGWPVDTVTGKPVKPVGVGTLLREYVQLETPANVSWSKHVPLMTENVDGTQTPIMMPDGVTRAVGVDNPHYLGPVIVTDKDRPARVTFYNLLPTGAGGDLYIPTDSTMMGSGYGPLLNWPVQIDDGTVLDDIRNPECTQAGKSADTNCFKDSRATLHLHGGTTPWISDGTPHQWSTPYEADATNPWPEGDSVGEVPDMHSPASLALGVPDCSGKNDGCQTFYWTNQQSARLMFYHDHAFGTTRLNVYLGEAAGYLISDDTDKKLQGLNPDGTINPALPEIIPRDQIPLVIQDRTFVPSTAQLAEQDPTWDYTRWGGEGDFWYHHVYMPAQNPGDPTGMSAYGRWMYGPWFWPPADPPHGPIANPYYNMDPATNFTTALAVPCNLNDSTTWQYQTDPFCEPPLIPGTPNISAGMEQFNDTPLVNGTAYPTITVEPKAYRLRVLNAANDRFFNLQLYVADPLTGNTEVALKQAELDAAQIDPNIFPTPVDSTPLGGPESTLGPNWIVIANEGGFLPTPVEVDGQQPTTWIIDPTVFNVGNVDKFSLMVGPAERTDAIVDFSAYAGQTLILYNDAPAAYPARVSTYDYYTGAPNQYPIGAPATLPGYGPNTRTVMQIKVAATKLDGSAPDQPYNLTALQDAFSHKADGSGVFESGQHPIIVGQEEYNQAYGTNFVAFGDCKRDGTTLCDGHLRVPDQGGTNFVFNTLLTGTADTLAIPIEPKAIHDEMNAAAFDEFGRMTANLGLEVVPASPVLQNIVLYPYINPPTELIDATNLPKNQIGMEMLPISFADGTQIWRITHNGVDTHPIHFHLYDVQLLNRVTWDNIIEPPDPTELGWKDTVRTSPLEDTIVALRPLIPALPWEIPNSVRPLNPAKSLGDILGFNNIDPNGVPTSPIVNQNVNFGWEYVWHCHILSHEEMDMMRPQAVAVPPIPPELVAGSFSVKKTSISVDITDMSITETAYQLQLSFDGSTWMGVATVPTPLDAANTTGNVVTLSYKDNALDFTNNVYGVRVAALNTVGYGGEFPSMTAQSVLDLGSTGPAGSTYPTIAPTNLAATIVTGPSVSLTWTDSNTNETSFVVMRSTDGVNFTQIGTSTTTSFIDTSVVAGTTYVYEVAAANGLGISPYSAPLSVTVPALPATPTMTDLVPVLRKNKNLDVSVAWTISTPATSYEVQWSPTVDFATPTSSGPLTTLSYTASNIDNVTWFFRVGATNVSGTSWSQAVMINPL